MKSALDARDQVAAAIAKLPRVRLTELPTRLEQLYNLSDLLGVDIWVKRDDLTGLALGGNKVRELEFHLGDAVAAGADTIVTTGNSQSNHARTTAAACAKLGLECYLVLERGLRPRNGNLLLDHLFGAHCELLPEYTPEIAVEAMEARAANLRNAGRQPHIVPFGGCSTTGTVGFVGAALELCEQLGRECLQVNSLYMASASCGTQAGMLAGITASGMSLPIRGISVSDPRSVQEPLVRDLANETLNRIGLAASIAAADVDVDDSYIGQGYGQPTSETWEAVKLAAGAEGILLDPVYTGKAMAALIHHARTGIIPPESTVVFLHTGGVPALFAYGEDARTAAQQP